jgi:lactate racemase
MQVAVEYGEERIDFEIPADRVVGVWRGPMAVPSADVKALVREALESPIQYPPLRQAVVPGDRVVIPIDPEVPEAALILAAVCETLQAAGVTAGDIEVLASSPPAPGWVAALPAGVSSAVHEPDLRAQLAYLASTPEGHRIYLNRTVTDADYVIPIGALGYDSVFGYRGPWNVIFPGLSDSESLRLSRSQASDLPADRTHERAALTESAHVSWLLGSQFQMGVLAGVGGVAGVVAGLDAAVRDAGTLAVDAAWAFESERRAELVVVGIGRPGVAAGIDELAEGLTAATRLVQHGGKIIALSRASGPIGPALRRLTESGEARPDPSLLRGLDGEADYQAARQLVRALAWADIYLLSALGEDEVDGLGMVALGRPSEAQRLAAKSGSSLFVSHADCTRAHATDDAD